MPLRPLPFSVRTIKRLISARNKLLHRNHATSQTRHQSKPHRVKVAHVAVALYSLLNSNWPRALCGISVASAVPNVDGHWIQHWLAMDPIRKSIAVRATLSCSDQRVSVTVTPQPWSPPAANQR